MIAQILLPCAPLCLWWCWGCHWDGENWQGSTKTPDPPNPTCPRTAPHPRCYQGNNTLLKQIIKRVKLWRPKRNRNPLLKGQERKLIQKQIIPCSKKKCPAEVISQPAFSCPHTEQQWHFLFSTTANKSSFAEQLQAPALRNQDLQVRNEAVARPGSSATAWHSWAHPHSELQVPFGFGNAPCWAPGTLIPCWGRISSRPVRIEDFPSHSTCRSSPAPPGMAQHGGERPLEEN